MQLNPLFLKPVHCLRAGWGRTALIPQLWLTAAFCGGSLWSQPVNGLDAPQKPTVLAEQVPRPQEVPSLATPPQPDLILVANTLVSMELLQEVSTKKSKPDVFFDLRVAEAVQIMGRTAIPANAKAVGQVIDSQKGGIFGNPAKLLIAIRYVELDGKRIAMRFYQPERGDDRTAKGVAMGAVPILGIFAAFMKGGEIVLPVGTKLVAKVAKDTPIQAPTPSTNPSAPVLADPSKGVTP